MTESPRERLHRLIAEFRDGSLDTESFCSRFETTYNLELDKQTLAPVEAESFAALFEQVIWYSPFPDERAQMPSYRSEQDIALAVEHAAKRFVGIPGIAGVNDPRLSAFETAVMLEFRKVFGELRGIDPSLLIVRRREVEPIGFFTHVAKTESARVFREDRSPRLSRLCGRLGPDQIDTGYVLSIDGGYLTMIEGFTFDGDWPKQVEPWTFYWIEETPLR